MGDALSVQIPSSVRPTLHDRQFVSGRLDPIVAALEPFCTVCTWGQMGGWSFCRVFCPPVVASVFKLFVYLVVQCGKGEYMRMKTFPLCAHYKVVSFLCFWLFLKSKLLT